MAALPPQRAERAALCDLLDAVGPDAPTLCAGWTTRDLAAHLVIRERNPLAGPGLVLGGSFAALTARIMARTKDAHTYAQLVARVRSGPPPWTAPFDALINLTEYFVHHEDVRRGAGDTTPRPVTEIAAVEGALWRWLRRASRFMTRPLGTTGLELTRTDDQGVGDNVLHARSGRPTASLSGRPGEIVLFLSGRAAAAHVELSGPPEAVDAVREARLGL